MVLYYAHRVVFLLLYFTSQQAASSIQIIKIMVHCSCLLSTVIMVVQTRGGELLLVVEMLDVRDEGVG
jgi:hypothetical protein